ncbi:MAG: hypothetical protein ABIT38_21855 [Gemmatimonadaceae bacterium]
MDERAKPPSNSDSLESGLDASDKVARNQFRDANEHLSMEMPKPSRFFVLISRALRAKCPHCGRGPVLVNWFKLRAACGNCGLSLERGEQDYFLGGMLFNLILAELLFAFVFVTLLVVLWPRVPWDGIQIGAPLGMAITPFVTYPIGKLLWLAFDLTFRPEGKGAPTRG